MLTFDQAAKLGYTVEPDADEPDLCHVVYGGCTIETIRSDCPRFFALRAIAERTDDDLATAEVTADLVKQTSGETYAPVEPPPVVATSDDANTAAAQIVTGNLAAAGVNTATLPAIYAELLGEAKSAIPYFEKFALDPSMNAPQWTAFQALPQAEKDRLLYDLVRSMAAVFRYLSGTLAAAGKQGATMTAPTKKKT
jgi:hypothetical protein